MHEAKLIAELIHSFQLLYAPSGKNPSIGIITPYRAQIAQIRRVLEEEKMDAASITIDTVERYQGGARDVILISLCTNSTDQMRAMISLSEEGVDRKLNVALTRARQHLVILGNPGLLETNDVYRQLIAHCRDVD
jgi:DNA replication ATP-dependent helicase Dna2